MEINKVIISNLREKNRPCDCEPQDYEAITQEYEDDSRYGTRTRIGGLRCATCHKELPKDCNFIRSDIKTTMSQQQATNRSTIN